MYLMRWAYKTFVSLIGESYRCGAHSVSETGRMHPEHTKLFPLLEEEIDGPITLKSFEKAKYKQ